METQEFVKLIRIDMKCPNCDLGRMRSSGMVLTSLPPKYEHFCNVCGYKENYDVSYPYLKGETQDEKISS